MPSSVEEVRREVFARDGQCIAPVVDKHAGPCYDQWGTAIDRFLPVIKAWDVLEMDYVRLGATGGRHELPGDHVMLCPGHHRGTGPSAGYQWATSHRPDERRYLDRMDDTRNG